MFAYRTQRVWWHSVADELAASFFIEFAKLLLKHTHGPRNNDHLSNPCAFRIQSPDRHAPNEISFWISACKYGAPRLY